ncbi:MAG: ABC transporter transmembrane domain-containing protein, partial [Xanthomonadales bacterium]|nr:ABC transporter transmembrane domain-containing protein [Xanthomonadales bacterium]
MALILMSAAALPFLYLTLELPKIIVNDAIGGENFPRIILGYPFEQIPFLLLLCGLFLSLVVISGVLKFFTATYRYRIGDRLLRRLRYDLIERLLRFPPAELRNMSSGQVVSMITAETTNLGFFIAEAFAVPAIAFGTLATIVLFMFLQNWMMGVAAIALFPLQIYLIPKIQKRINTLQRGEVDAIRGISQRITDTVAG